MNRCRHDIVMDVLRSIRDGKRRITEICTSANLPLDRGKRVLISMVNRGLITVQNGEFRILPKGYSWMEMYKLIEE